ncbi:MAG: hypothetical protein ACRD3Q_02230 [Terriglobales bacterium]
MNIALWAKVEQLEKEIEALKRQIAPRPNQFQQRNAVRKDEGIRLRDAILQVLAAHPDQAHSAKHVLRALSAMDIGRSSLPSVRAVQWHLKAIKDASNTAVLRNSINSALDA